MHWDETSIETVVPFMNKLERLESLMLDWGVWWDGLEVPGDLHLALAKHAPNLKRLWISLPFAQELTPNFLEDLQMCSMLEEVNLNSMDLNPQSMDLFSQIVGRQPNLQTVSFENVEFSPSRLDLLKLPSHLTNLVVDACSSLQGHYGLLLKETGHFA